MIRIHFFCCIILLCLCLEGRANEEADVSKVRIWTAVTGHRALGTLLKVDETTVKLKLTNGKESCIPIEKLCDNDKQWLRNFSNMTSTESRTSSLTSEATGDISAEQRIHKFMEEGKTRLSGEEGIAAYQQLQKDLCQYIPEYNLPKDMEMDGHIVNKKYIKKIEIKNVPIAERKNLFTGEQMPTERRQGEPKWETVSQTLNYTFDDYNNVFAFIQSDTLKVRGKTKTVQFRLAVRSRSWGDSMVVDFFYLEHMGDYSWKAQISFDKSDQEKYCCTMKSKIIGFIDIIIKEQKFFYYMNMVLNNEGDIWTYDSNRGSLRFIVGKNSDIFPMHMDKSPWSYLDFCQDAYDFNGTPISLEKEWNGHMKEAKKKAAGIPDNPLNIFKERNSAKK